MASTETPMHAANLHVANAEDYLAQGLIVLAADEYLRAAEAYTSAIERSNDESAKRTLRRLFNEQCKAAKDLQRKIDRLKEEGKDPSLPQKSDRELSPQVTNTIQHTSNAAMGVPRIYSPSPHHTSLGRPMTDSNTGDESFMLLGGQRSDPGDAFNQFWNIMQGMLDNLSQPVAFATIPLSQEPDSSSPITANGQPTPENHRDSDNFSSDTDLEEPILSKFSRKIGLGRKLAERPRRSTSQKAISPVVSQGLTSSNKSEIDFDDEEDDFLDAGDDLSGSFFFIPTGPEASPAALKKENTSLKGEIALLKRRLEGTERVLKLRREQDIHLRDSIFQATREAQRALGASGAFPRPPQSQPPDFNNLNMNVPAIPIPGINSAREAQYTKRIKELEEELRLMKVENDKNKLMIAKFRERWEKLKDSAKRKKEAKAVAEIAATGVRDRIVEEPEAEEELDDKDSRS